LEAKKNSPSFLIQYFRFRERCFYKFDYTRLHQYGIPVAVRRVFHFYTYLPSFNIQDTYSISLTTCFQISFLKSTKYKFSRFFLENFNFSGQAQHKNCFICGRWSVDHTVRRSNTRSWDFIEEFMTRSPVTDSTKFYYHWHIYYIMI
jgi:hypothetical protein